MKKITILIAIICTLSLFAEQKNGIVYVKAGATGTGASWADALGDIQAAVTLAKADNLNRKDVWVGTGDYSISTCISLTDSVNVYGSFAGTETAVSERAKVVGGRAWEFVTPTTLHGSGARLIQVSAASLDVETLFDGFVLTDGNGTGSATNNSGGAAMIRPNSVVQNCIIRNSTATGAGGGIMLNGGGTVRYCLIKDNTHTTGANGGGGIFCNTSSTGFNGYIENCVISGNSSTVRGAGIGFQGTTGFVGISNCEIFNNTAYDATAVTPVLKGGGAIYNNNLANNRVINCLIYNNSGLTAVYFNGGSFYNNTVVKNVGGVYITGAVNCVNNIIWACATDVTGTTATGLTGVVNASTVVQNNATYNPISAVNSWTLADNILLSSNVSNGDVTNPAAGTVGSGPKFGHVTRYFGSSTTADEKLQLDTVNWSIPMTSPCLNVGKTLTAVTTDIVGLSRPQGYPLATALPDMGAYELPYYTVVVGEPASANGAVYTALGELIAENHSSAYAKGSKVEFLFQPNASHSLFKAYYTSSTDGGSTFTGAVTDFTAQIGNDGFWTGTINSNIKISVVWDGPNALSALVSDNIKCLVSSTGVTVMGLSAGDLVSVYGVNGILAAKNKVVANQAYIALAKGVYILRVADKAQKLIVK